MAATDDAERLGLWLVGARGAVATTVAVGHAALTRGLAGTTGLVTELPAFAEARLTPWDHIVLGGHEVRSGTLESAARVLAQRDAVFPLELVDACRDELAAVDARVRPGALLGSDGAATLATPGFAQVASTPRAAIERLKEDLHAFRAAERLGRVVVVLVASTEPPTDVAALPTTWRDLRPLLEATAAPLRASTLYAVAALESGMPFVNFTPSLGASLPALEDLSHGVGVPHAGRDGKTGETLVKTVLAPLFARRNLEVLSWVGHNILGNDDGRVLEDPGHKASKVQTKDAVLAGLLGYAPQSRVTIEYVPSLGDRKTAWDHVHFRGFLGAQMTLQFTWQGCDSALAAPLVLDLARLAALGHRRGERGALGALGAFFKSPVGSTTHDLAAQHAALESWARGS